MVAASEIIGLMNVEDLTYEIRVQNTFIHVSEPSRKRRMSAPALLAVLNCDNATAQATDDGIVYSLDDYSSSGEDCDSTLDDPWDDRQISVDTASSLKDAFAPSDMQDEPGDASIKTDDQQCDRNMQTLAGVAASTLDDCAHSIKQVRASEPRKLFFEGKACKAHAAAWKNPGHRGSARSKAFTKVFIGNLPCSMSTDRMAVELCKHGFFGTYTSVNVPCNAAGIGRGFGFVTFCSAEEAQRFVSVISGCEFEGQHCYANPAAQQSNPCIHS
eukprot:TRINITY_DN13720_c0_g2_i1.p1 TRINITY_DN13720_c0_g2~~TRINITY_DN13720_c0_g2_i1.p1  ORF type:complete len:299 (-),score=58.34 TRINITY_DN13720_c0_g2_i1:418-1233(-)